MNRFVRLSIVLALSLLMGGASDQPALQNVVDPLPLLSEPLAEDEIFNDGASSPTILFSLIQGGMSSRTIDGGNNIDNEAVLRDVFGADTAIGTFDDDLNPTTESPVVDAGSNVALPPDRFDLDGDGNTTEPLPVDRAGNERKHDGGLGSRMVDIGAYEFGAQVATFVQESTDDAFRTYLTDPFPNPTANGFAVRFGVQSPSAVRIIVYDALGREVTSVYETLAQRGRDYLVHIPTNSLASGVYFVRLKTEAAEISRQFVLTR